MFYAKLALSTIRKNKQSYLPFLIAMITLTAINTMVQGIVRNPGMEKLPDSGSAIVMFNFGIIVITIFSVIFSLYTNSFLLKQRKKELGLYNILGLGKRELYQLLFFENVYCFIIVFFVGTISGIVLSRLGFLALKKLMGVGDSFVYQLNIQIILWVAIVFASIFFFLYLLNCFQIHQKNTIALFQGAKEGEREPKANWLVALLGFLLLGSGYFFALTIESPLQALTVFFFAVILVIAGTYSVFSAGSIVILKLLKRNKHFYYKTNHLVSVSSMMYRMKQNAAGLASICILSTMVLVTVTTTASLFFGQQDIINRKYPQDIMLSTNELVDEKMNFIEKFAADQQVELTDKLLIKATSTFLLEHDKMQYNLLDNADNQIKKFDTLSAFSFTTLQNYRNWTGETAELSDGEILVFPRSGAFNGSTLNLNGNEFKVKEVLNEVKGMEKTIDLTDEFFIIVKDEAVLNRLLDQWYPNPEDAQLKTMKYSALYNIDFPETERRLSFVRELNAAFSDTFTSDLLELEFKDEEAESTKSFNGGFLFLGIIFGVIFILATALIIYYKQVSEGSDDRERFVILQKVGMSHHEVKRVIHSQILLIFAFPLLMAVIHLAFAFRLIQKLLILFGLVNFQLYLVITVFVVLIFAVIYYLVYQITARAYFHIVER